MLPSILACSTAVGYAYIITQSHQPSDNIFTALEIVKSALWSVVPAIEHNLHYTVASKVLESFLKRLIVMPKFAYAVEKHFYYVDGICSRDCDDIARVPRMPCCPEDYSRLRKRSEEIDVKQEIGHW